jgi:branched-chain amino acid transport system ATP-binding protein
LEIAIALATNPRFLLLDEPAAGMSHIETQSMKILIKQLTSRGLTIILVEHNMRLVMDICDRVLVLNFGRKLAEGLPQEIRNNRDVIDAYTGGKVGGGYAVA